ncbi:unnamed protein product [Rotaria sp. Silwood1]|nr:unnamed protein product [Rotaria sp. Silwood1]
MCITCVLFWLLFFGHRLILYRTTSGSCTPLPGFYAYFDNYVEASVTAMGTPLVMIVLAVLLLRSVRGITQRRIVPKDGGPPAVILQGSDLHQIDSRLTLMLFL